MESDRVFTDEYEGGVAMKVSDLSTPALVVYLSKVKKNASVMLERCVEYGVKLRPHFKTSKVA